MIINILILSSIIFIIDLPFGYWRASVKAKSYKWFLAIHIPIPFIIILRFLFKIDFVWYSFPFTFLSFFLGQFIGGKLYKQKL